MNFQCIWLAIAAAKSSDDFTMGNILFFSFQNHCKELKLGKIGNTACNITNQLCSHEKSFIFENGHQANTEKCSKRLSPGSCFVHIYYRTTIANDINMPCQRVWKKIKTVKFVQEVACPTAKQEAFLSNTENIQLN